ncbi:beta-1,3-galactosyltransferase 5-like [Anticarsia gemmatalis]|uniref:beta-1,3-galactosyltransferase 5-like n=1 Tax=Anticarsia gemmatalis TaxID=129554 RepID=UPI003F76A0CD
MLHLLFRIIVKKFVYGKVFGGRRNILLVLPLLASFFVVWYTWWWLVLVTSKALLPPPPPDQNLHHFRQNRNLEHYINNIPVLVEPSSTPCATADEVPVIVLVSSAPHRFEHRQAVRQTWAKHQLTYFVLGLYGDEMDEQLVDNYVEAKQYGDMVVFDFHDHYQNLTLKTALMLHWTLDRCPQVMFLFKTDDDVLVNPWTLKTVLKENQNAKLLGYKIWDRPVHRDEYTKWYMPRWLYPQETIPQYLSGTGYLINGEYLPRILKKAYKVPLVNLEDVYFTYLVAYKTVGLKLSHDRRLNPYKPWVPLSCAYGGLASTHSFSPDEMVATWPKIETNRDDSCGFLDSYMTSDFILF